MLKESVVYLIGAILLLQSISAVPHVRRDAATEKNDPRESLFVYTIAEMLILSQYSLEVSRPLFTNVLKELNALPTRSEALQANITTISDFLKDTEDVKIEEDPEQVLKVFKYMIDFVEIMDNLEKMPAEQELTKTLLKAFDNSGVNKVEADFKEHLVEMMKKFSSKFEKYLHAATAEQKTRDHKMIEWYNKFKAVTDEEEKLEFFFEFFDVAE